MKYQPYPPRCGDRRTEIWLQMCTTVLISGVFAAFPVPSYAKWTENPYDGIVLGILSVL